MGDIRQAAGFYEGEGCCVRKRSGGKSWGDVVIAVPQKDPWPLYWLKERFGGSVYSWKVSGTGAPYHRWDIGGPRGRGFALTIFTFLSPRRKAQIVRAFKTR